MPGRLVYTGFLLVLLMFTALVVVLSVMLLFLAETTQGRWAACAYLLGTPSLWGLLSQGLRRHKGMAIACVTGLLLGAFCFVFTLRMVDEDTYYPCESIWLGKPGNLRHSPANLVPEIDQLKLASYLVHWVDPYIDLEKSRRIRSLFLEVYRDMEDGERYHSSVMNYAYRELFLLPWDSEHLFASTDPYSPAPEGSYPAMVFLHGSGGNFSGYMQVWSSFSRIYVCKVVAPDFGFGNWARKSGVGVVDRTVEYIRTRNELDPDRMILAGLSNGGLGVTRSAIAHPERWKALLYISPVIEPHMMEAVADAIKPHDVPVYVINGAEDLRIPSNYVQRSVDILRRRGIRVEHEVIPGEDHFLLFSQRPLITAFAARALRRE